jgi:hypothetical protein
MVLTPPFNHGPSIGFTMSGKITGEKMMEAWNVFTGAGTSEREEVQLYL